MRRRLAMTVVAIVLLLPVAASGAGVPYEHVWRVEDLYVGDAGTTQRSVGVDTMQLQFADGEWSGQIRLADVLAIQESTGITQSQNASISLTLEGAPAEGGASAAGRFSGVAELRFRQAASLEDALAPSKSGALAVYDVSGFWAAKLDGDVAKGQLVFRSASPRDGSKGPVRDADWFNRAPEEGLDATGQPQPFKVAVTGLDPDSGNPAEPGEKADGTPKPGFFDYVGRGLRGQSVTRALPVSAAQAAAAEALKAAGAEGATPLPDNAIGIDSALAGAYLDAKNRAAGMLDERMVPTGPVSVEGIRAVQALYASAPGRRAPGDNDDPTTFYKTRLLGLLEGDRIERAADLRGEVSAVGRGADPDTVTRLRAWLSVLEAVAGPPPSQGSAITPVIRAGEQVASQATPRTGALADAVLAAADSPEAPSSARDVALFEREASLDSSATTTGDALPNRVLAVAGVGGPPPGLTWGGGSSIAQPDSWLGWRRGDGRLFFRAGEQGDVALTDATLSGWAWRHPRASLVDAGRIGRVQELYALP